MNEREMRSSAAERGSPGGGPTGDQLNALRRDGQRMLAAADEAIRRALSGDSTDFLRSCRQEGGQ